jgi:hypothetical protein
MITVNQALQLLGLGSPFVVAAGTYGLFAFLDRKASGAAKQAVSNWISRRKYDGLSITDTILEAFNNIYTPVLLSLDALARSTVYSVIIIALFLVTVQPIYQVILATLAVPCTNRSFQLFYFSIAVANLISDYLSLFLVRWWLLVARNYPGKALFGGIISGTVLILLTYTFSTLLIHNFLFLDSPHWENMSFSNVIALSAKELNVLLLFGWPAFLVYFWLPLVIVGMIGARLINWVGNLIAWAQWFIKRGNVHPFQAIGLVAAVLMFLSASAGEIIYYSSIAAQRPAPPLPGCRLQG